MKHIQLFEAYPYGGSTLKPVDITRPGDVLVFLKSIESVSVALMSQAAFTELGDLLKEKNPYEYEISEVSSDPGLAYVYVLYDPVLGETFGEFKDASFQDETSEVNTWATGESYTPNPNSYKWAIGTRAGVDHPFDTVFVLKRGMVISEDVSSGGREETIKNFLRELRELISKEQEGRKAAEKEEWSKNPQRRDFRDNSGWKEIEIEMYNFSQKFLSNWGKLVKLPEEQKKQIMKQRSTEFNTLLQKAKNILKEWENRLDSEYYNSVLLPAMDQYQLYFERINDLIENI
jgi:hypothetical protein